MIEVVHVSLEKTIEELSELTTAEWTPITVEDLKEFCDYSGVVGACDFAFVDLEENRTGIRYTRVLRFITVHVFDMWSQVVRDEVHVGWVKRNYVVKTYEEVTEA